MRKADPDRQIEDFNELVDEIVSGMREKVCPFLHPQLFVKFNRGKPLSMMIVGTLANFRAGVDFDRFDTASKRAELFVFSCHFEIPPRVKEFGKKRTEMLFWAFSRYYPGVLAYRSFKVTYTDFADLPEADESLHFNCEEFKKSSFHSFDESVLSLFENPFFRD